VKICQRVASDVVRLLTALLLNHTESRIGRSLLALGTARARREGKSRRRPAAAARSITSLSFYAARRPPMLRLAFYRTSSGFSIKY
jgi:hypothetical protein